MHFLVIIIGSYHGVKPMGWGWNGVRNLPGSESISKSPNKTFWIKEMEMPEPAENGLIPERRCVTFFV
jgi:hypothetical protein